MRASVRIRLATGLVAAGVLAVLAACGSPNKVSGSFSLNPSGTVTIVPGGQSGNTVAVTVTNVTTWSATSDSGFVTITGGGSGGASGGTLTYSVAANTGAARTANINFTGDNNAAATLQISQGVAPTFGFTTPSPVALSANAQSPTAALNANVAWSVASDQSFLTLSSPTTGSAGATINYSVTANTGTASRQAHITATSSGLPNSVLTVNQAGLTANFTFTATAAVTGGDCAVKPSPSGSSAPAQIFCTFDPSSSSPSSGITTFKFNLLEENNEQIGAGNGVAPPVVSPLTQCGFGNNTATPVTIRLTVTSASGTATVDKTVILVKAGVC
jgi:hypothetical protein